MVTKLLSVIKPNHINAMKINEQAPSKLPLDWENGAATGFGFMNRYRQGLTMEGDSDSSDTSSPPPHQIPPSKAPPLHQPSQDGDEPVLVGRRLPVGAPPAEGVFDRPPGGSPFSWGVTPSGGPPGGRSLSKDGTRADSAKDFCCV